MEKKSKKPAEKRNAEKRSKIKPGTVVLDFVSLTEAKNKNWKGPMIDIESIIMG